MKKTVNEMLDKYGSVVKIMEKGNTITTKAFVQPLRKKYSTYFDLKELPAGITDRTRYLLVGKPSLVLNRCGGQLVECDGVNYMTNANGSYSLRGEILYVWAVLTACTDASEDDYENN